MSDNVELSDVVEFIADCEHKTAPHAAAGTDYAYSVGTRDIKQGRIELALAKQVDRKTYEAWTRRGRPQDGDLILAREAPVGQVGHVTGTARICLGQRTVLIRPDRAKVDPRYLHYLLLSPPVQQWMQDRADGSIVPHLNVADVRQASLGQVLPSLPAQRAIAAVLSALDDKIEVNTTVVLAADRLLQAIFDRSTEQSGVTHTADQVLEPILGGTPARDRSDYWAGSIAWASAKDVASSFAEVITSPAESISQLGLAESPAKTVPTGTTLITARGTVGALARTASTMSFNQTCYALVPLRGLPPLLLFLALRQTVAHLKSLTHGTVFETITKQTFAMLPVRLPPEREWSKLTSQLSPLDELIQTAISESGVLRQLRDVLLPPLLSGRVRVQDADGLVEEAV